MISKEQHMNIIENQRKNYEQIKEKRRRTTEKPMKNQRRRFPSLMGKEIRDTFEEKNES